jgi:hypothetical protein
MPEACRERFETPGKFGDSSAKFAFLPGFL